LNIVTDFTSRLPRNLYRAADVRQLDRIAIDELGIAGFKLMQTAGATAFNALLEQWPQVRFLRVYAGSGNNGGDGYILAGLAREFGLSVEVIQVGDSANLRGDAKRAMDWAQQQQVTILGLADFQQREELHHAHTVIVDALLGTGLDRDVTGDYRQVIEGINAADYPVLAIDIPSGLNADTGNAMGSTIEADVTVTFIGMKRGLLSGQGRDFAGTIVFNDLDVPARVYNSDASPQPTARRIDINTATECLVPRAQSSHKGNHGHVLIIGGNHGYGGAALLAAEAALRSGAGLVSVLTRSAHRPALLARRPEIMVSGTEDEHAGVDALVAKADVIVIGPGLGRNQWSRDLLQLALSAQVAANKPLVVDADGLNLLSERVDSGAPLRRDNWILTPHPGEAACLLGRSVADIQQDRFAAVEELTNRWGGCCLLKGSGSLICVGSRDSAKPIYLCTEGNAGMATGGMGDVLSGITAALVAQGLTLEQSLCCAVCIHGEAADLAMESGGQRGMVATDLFPFIRQLVNPAL